MNSLGVASKASDEFREILTVSMSIRLSKSFDIKFPKKNISFIGTSSNQAIFADMHWINLLISSTNTVVVRLQDNA